MSTFGSLNAATTALWAQRRALDVTGQNIANVNTEGYSRQRVELQSIGGSVVPAFFSTSNGLGGGVNADAIAQLRQSTTGTDANYRKMIVELGVQAAVAGRNVDIQAVITTQVDSARESVAGVNIDEEMTNMLSFQHAYSAAGRLITAIDETLDKLINGTGRVGL